MCTAEGFDAFVDVLDGGAPIVIGDMGSGSGRVVHQWFDAMYESAHGIGVAFTAVGIVRSDPASVESVLSWAQALQDRVSYLIVKNALTEAANFTYWERSTAAEQFRHAFQPGEIEMEYRLPKYENVARQHGVTLGQARSAR